MTDLSKLAAALATMSSNPEQLQAVNTRTHCILLAGPGSGKTKTLTTAIANALAYEVREPRGVACITYSNECASELESRLFTLGIEPTRRIFIGTVHSFALTQIIMPYVRCVMPELPHNFKIASIEQCIEARRIAFAGTAGLSGDAEYLWKKRASPKRKSIIDRSSTAWSADSPHISRYVENYETQLRHMGLIDFDDMPLIAAKLVKDHNWISEAVSAKFPIIYVDEYQDLGVALHDLVTTLCLNGASRLFAVGDPDQSIYAFTQANPELLIQLAARSDVTAIRLRFNYRCGTRIVIASEAALGQNRGYVTPPGASEGEIFFNPLLGNFDAQASHVVSQIILPLASAGHPLDEIAVLYRDAKIGGSIARAAKTAHIPFLRADNEALVKRNSIISRFAESCAKWAVGGWADGEPRFRKLADQAVTLVHGAQHNDQQRQLIESELITLLNYLSDPDMSTHLWLQNFRSQLVEPWILRTSMPDLSSKDIDEMIRRTRPNVGEDLLLSHFAGRVAGSGNLTLSTLHSAKGREFDVVILFGMNNGVIPSVKDTETEALESRRLFYVGVTRPRKKLFIVYSSRLHSPWVTDLYRRLQSI